MLRLESNGGYLDSRQKAKFGGLDVWFNVRCMANILSLALVTDMFRVTMDSEEENALVIHISDNINMKFTRNEDDLYVCDASKADMPALKRTLCFLTTVDQNKAFFKAREVCKADQAVELNRKLNHMAKDTFIRIIKDGWLRDCPVTVGDVRRSHAIYGPLIPPMKGRARYQESPRVKDRDIVQIPKEVFECLKHVTLCVDFHYVNGMIVFHSISRQINYRTVAFPNSRSKGSMLKHIREVQRKYHSRGFRITDIHADSEFEKARNDLLPIRMETCGTDDHVPEVERDIQTQKNQNRSVCHAMPYKCFPKVVLRAIVK